MAIRESFCRTGWMLKEEQEFTQKRGGEGISGRRSSIHQDPAVVLGTSPQTGRGGEW